MAVELNEHTQRVLRRLRPEANLEDSVAAITLDALRLRLRQCVDELGAFEARYGRHFEQFAAEWNAGEIQNAFSHGVERDYMEWEALVAEHQELLGLIREFAEAARAGV